jgi:phosphoglycolate phosphatase-like HAD superfamily hydrolase
MHLETTKIWDLKRSGATTREALLEFTGHAAVSDQVAALWQQIVEDPFWLGMDTVLPGVDKTLVEMRASGSRLHLLTARSAAVWVPSQLARLGLDGLLDEIIVVSPSTAAASKADLLRKKKIRLFFGDTESDFRAATNASVHFFGVATGQRNKEFLNASGIPYVFDSLHEAWIFSRKISV